MRGYHSVIASSHRLCGSISPLSSRGLTTGSITKQKKTESYDQIHSTGQFLKSLRCHSRVGGNPA
ncbi:hypothetical protein [Rickettsia asembonensis]|uniref:hypothetical protein n=1 Tax=Rickettsia asembonensis TaxID=1068590 RepID=UPI000AD80E1D|nr:hypothetical protein [Rickettsia asembonensis]